MQMQMQQHPKTFDEFLKAPCFVINLDDQPDRWISSEQRLSTEGFTNIERFKGVHGATNAAEKWKLVGSPRFDDKDSFSTTAHKQGVFLSHVLLWKHIIDNKIPYATIFEDDLLFHKDWNFLAPQYFENTPQDYGMLFLGHHSYWDRDGHIMQVPVYCLNAYAVTYHGAKFLYDLLLHNPSGVYTIDCMIWDKMCDFITTGDESKFCTWYIWNALAFAYRDPRKHPEFAFKDNGLVFQDATLTPNSSVNT